jgi:hypothetical protein
MSQTTPAKVLRIFLQKTGDDPANCRELFEDFNTGTPYCTVEDKLHTMCTSEPLLPIRDDVVAIEVDSQGYFIRIRQSGTAFKKPVFYVPGGTSIIDLALVGQDGIIRGVYSNETIEEMAIRYPGVAIGEMEMVHASCEETFKTNPAEITAEQYQYGLEVLPPVDWIQANGSSFKMSERQYGNITTIYCSLLIDRQRRYFSFNDNITLPHEQIIDRCRAAATSTATQ